MIYSVKDQLTIWTMQLRLLIANSHIKPKISCITQCNTISNTSMKTVQNELNRLSA